MKIKWKWNSCSSLKLSSNINLSWLYFFIHKKSKFRSDLKISNLYRSTTKKYNAGLDLVSYKTQSYLFEIPCHMVTSKNLPNLDLELFRLAASSGFAHTKLSHMSEKRDVYIITYRTLRSSYTRVHTFIPVSCSVLQSHTAPEAENLVISRLSVLIVFIHQFICQSK